MLAKIIPLPQKAVRHELDFYPSPHWFLTDLLRFFKFFGRVGEVCCGDGAIADLLPEWHAIDSTWTNDINPDKPADYHLDATKPESWSLFPPTDFICTNPPYGEASAKILKLAHAHAKVGVAMFLRHSFLEPCEDRAEFLEENPPSLILVYPRYKFRKGKEGRWTTDNGTISAMIWDKRSPQQRIIVRPSKDIALFHDRPDSAPTKKEIVSLIDQIASGQLQTNYLTYPSGSLTQVQRLSNNGSTSFRWNYTYKGSNGKTQTFAADKFQLKIQQAIQQERGICWIVEEIFKKRVF